MEHEARPAHGVDGGNQWPTARRVVWVVLLLLSFFAVLLVLAVAQLRDALVELQTRAPSCDRPRCNAIPTRFIMQEPECANKHVAALGVENVHVSRYTPRNSSDPPQNSSH